MRFVLTTIILLSSSFILADAVSAAGLPAISVLENGDATEYSLTLQLLALMTVLSLLPSLLLTLTSFIRIVIVLSLLRTALGTQQAPPNQVVLGLALFLTLFIMAPVFTAVYDNAVVPFLNEEISVDAALLAAELPMREFMLNQTRKEDIAMFVELSGQDTLESAEDVSISVLIPAFITSELKSAFIIGFLIYIPFVVIDLIVASVLMSMGMMMLSPMMISMPFKLMLFVLVDGWTLIIGSLASSFVIP